MSDTRIIEQAVMNDFGKALSEMNVEAFLNMRDWFVAAIENHGGKIIDTGMGAGKADLGVELDGCEFNVQIRPRRVRDHDEQDTA